MAGPWEKYASQKTSAAPAQAPTAGPWSKYADRIAAVSRVPKPEEPDRAAQAANWAGNASTAAGLAAPAIAMIQGAPVLPILGGLAGSAAAGAATDYALRKTGATPWLEEKARNLRADVPMPQTRSVPLNFIANLGIEATHPKAVAANVLEAAPMLASSYAGSKGALGGAKLPGFITKSVMGGPKVPVGQEAAALLNTGGKIFTPEMGGKSGKIEMGEMKQALEPSRKKLGSVVGEAEKAAIEAASSPENPVQVAQKAIEDALLSQGVPLREGKFVSQISKTPKEVREIARMLSQSATHVQGIHDMDVLAQQARAEAANLKGGLKPNPLGSAAYSKVAASMQDALEKFVPEPQVTNLKAARKDYAALKRFEHLVTRSGSQGEFSPAKFVSQWKTMTPSEKSNYFKPEQIKAIDGLVKQNEPGMLSAFADKVMKLGQVALARTVARGSGIGALLEKPAAAPIRFNAPETDLPKVKNIEGMGAVIGASESERRKKAARAKALAKKG